MRRLIQEIALAFILMLIVQTAFCQNKTIYFLADTINVSKNNQILKIGSEGTERYYSFFCKCIGSYNKDVSFKYLFKNGDKIQHNKPNVNYISWRELSELIYETGIDFDKHYTLIIVEPLSKNKFRVNPVTFILLPPPIY